MLSHDCVVGHDDRSPCHQTWLQCPGFGVSKQVGGAGATSLMCALKMEGSASIEGNTETRKLVKVKCMNLESEWCLCDSALLQRSERLSEADLQPQKGFP